jgi:cell division protein FtsQ
MAAKKPIDWRPYLKYGVMLAGLFLLLASGIFASQQMEQFLIRDPRFFLPGPADYGLESPNLEIEGIQFASRVSVLNVFSHDFGRSLYSLPLADRRKALLHINWVKEASVLRLWPNRVAVRISERQPAAFLDVKVEGMSRWSLIDSDGVILDPPARANFKLPVITGVLKGESTAMRGTRVRRMQRMMKELGSMADNVSEVNVSDLDDLCVTESMSGRAVVLMLGDQNFASRLRNFIDHYSGIVQKMPAATNFDLRLDDRITAVEGQRNGL